MLHKGTTDALKVLLELAGTPQQWRSTRELAAAQRLAEPMLEQLLLRLRRAGLLEARRGRLGGYRLARSAAAIAVADVLVAVEPAGAGGEALPTTTASDQVTRALDQRLQRTVTRALQELSLEELLYDLRSAEASRDGEAGLLLG